MKTIALAIAALLPLSAVATPALAAPAAKSVVVHYGDLDLASDQGRDKLDRRINYAAEKICGSNKDYRELSVKAKAKVCRNETIARTNAQVEVAVNKALESGPAVATAAAVRVGASN